MRLINTFLALIIFFLSIILLPSPTATFSCNDSKWNSELITTYSVTLVLTVDSSGCGNFTKVQDAIDAVPDSKYSATLIILNTGIYREKVNVRATKINLVMQGQGYLNTFIEWNDNGNLTGTFNSYSFGIFASNFTAYNISFKNTAPPAYPGEFGAQAVALRANGDQAAFYGCGFYGVQDTLHDDLGRHYFKECFIEGSIDFIFGNGRSLYEDCIISSIAKPEWTGDGGYITAQGQESPANQSGFSFVNCDIIGTGKILLGRPWKKFAKVVFSTTNMSEVVAATGWNCKLDDTYADSAFFGEYNCMGPGAIKTSPPRRTCGKQLKDNEASPYINISYIDGADWLRRF
ncbi:putative pectinesterase [Trifolium repens]|nr:putative pectinesterase [Trifolium repens]